MTEINLFFSPNEDDIRGSTYYGAFMTYGINELSSQVERGFPAAWDLAMAKKYPNRGAARDRDIHWEFADFFVSVGNYHGRLDPSSQEEERPRTSVLGKEEKTQQEQKGGQYVTLDKDPAQKLYERVYKRWNQLDESTKQFFEKYLDIIPVGSNIPIRNYSGISDSDLSKYRFNLKKYEKGTYPLFYGDIPVINKDYIKRYWETDKDPKTVDDDDYNLRALYMHGYNGTKQPNDKTIKSFSVNIASSLQDYLFMARKEYDTYDTVMPSKVLDCTTSTVWTYKNGKYVATIDGREVPYGYGDPATTKLLSQDQDCFGTGFPGENGNCSEFISKCIRNDDPDSLQKCFKWIAEKKINFTETVAKGIKLMHPKMAQKILEKFGIKTIKYQDPIANRMMYRVQTVDEWLSSLSDGEVVGIIKNNQKLKEYISLIIQYINCNPAILNDGYGGPVSPPPQPAYISKLHIQPRRELPINEYNKLKILGLTTGYGSLMRPSIIPPTPLRHPFLPVVAGNYPSMISLVQGGGGDTIVSSGSILEDLIRGLLAELEQRGKVIVPTDRAKIDAALISIKNMEKKIYSIFRYLQLYKKHISITGDTTAEHIPFAKLEEAVDGYNMIVKGHNNLEGTLFKVANEVLTIIKKADAEIGKQ